MSINGFEEVFSFEKKILSDSVNDGSEKFKHLITQWPNSWSQINATIKIQLNTGYVFAGKMREEKSNT